MAEALAHPSETGAAQHASGDRALAELLAQVRSYLPKADLSVIERAYLFAQRAHEGQLRISKEPFFNHPLSAARTLAELQLDPATIAAALLHDVAEDTAFGLEEVEKEFGAEIAQLVRGVTKLGKLNLATGEEGASARSATAAWAENLRKMFLAMAEDMRVVLIKLADRLHNMQTLDALPPERRRATAQETLEIYAPLAARLGIWHLKWQLEDMAFRELEQERYREIARQLATRRPERERYVARVLNLLREELTKAGIEAEVHGRPKHLYSIHQKMRTRGVDFQQIYDLFAVRVLVKEVADCYSALGVVHTLWLPIPGQFDDYIAMPKQSMYQSLHTTVIGPLGKPIEIQIRTYEMHRISEYGVAAHWRYKEGGRADLKFEEKVAWLRALMEWHRDVAGSAQEFVDSLKTDIFRDQVYVFTPKGDVKELPRGATPLDFAYQIHTDIGHRCIGSKVNGRLVALDHQLRTGDIVEILTTKANKGPSRDWLNPSLGFVRTAHAREKIRQWFRKLQRDENIARGRELLEKELARLGLTRQPLEGVANRFGYERLEDFLVAIACGEITTQAVASKLIADEEPPAPLAPTVKPPLPSLSGVKVTGVGDLLTRLAPCCSPMPGNAIVGYITRGRGVTIHRSDCPNIQQEDEPERLIPVEWGQAGEQLYPVTIRVEAWDREGLLRDVAAAMAEDKVSIVAANAEVHPDRTATILTTITVNNINKLSRVLARIEGIRDVIRVSRDAFRPA